MGIFDIFAKNERRPMTAGMTGNEYIDNYNKKNSPVQIRRPRSFSDVEEIIDNLKENKPVIVYLNELKDETSKRVLDILSGAIYALSGGMCELENDMYIFTPDGVNSK